jgi:hypothetical protein
LRLAMNPFEIDYLPLNGAEIIIREIGDDVLA